MALLQYDKVYVFAPYKFATGGIELAHQLVDYLRNKNREAYIVYADIRDGKIVTNDLQVTEQYKKYNIVVAPEVEDFSSNVVVLPEAYLMVVPRYKNAQVCVWWMSVDNAIMWNDNFNDTFRFEKGIINKLGLFKRLGGNCIKGTPLWNVYCKYIKHEYVEPKKSFVNRFSLAKLKKEDYRLFHFYQATYIQQFLYEHHFDRVIKLTDYINPEIINNVDTTKKKENIILYNPSKGLKYTENLMATMSGYKFIALKGFNREQLNNLFDTAKLYIDFGPFPGKDRLPREAAIHKCCIVTGRFGASGYFEDVPIYGKYKFDMTHANYSEIKKCIDDIFANYNERVDDFKYLRESIMREQENFYREIDNIFI